ncbi:O-succinylbenzoate synthase [Candidatus Enterovibrio escicola]|uniref:o-succinylbenzoate synthase n=2 Tax=Candidatus Enterovibrio escicola TaxID=1927127 RepID=A0A2A5T279_9GAMM|nr:O-succinylbenzoate synthase [Candidatus Enterovibrio escacola]
MMKHAVIYRYQLPIDSGVLLRHIPLVERVGFIVKLSCDDKIGLGEIAPLPEFSRESVDDAGLQAQQVLTQWLNEDTVDLETVYPSVAFGVSMALTELKGQLPQEGNYVVAPLYCGDLTLSVQKLMGISGQKVAKMKVGFHEAIREGAVASMFLEAIPDLMLRLDANRQWTPVKAVQFAKSIPSSLRERIAFLEEPCQTPEDSLVFSRETGIGIAWDETLSDDEFELEQKQGVKAIVIKPTLLGSLEKVQELISQAYGLGIEVVISSSLESSIGLNQLARVAHWLTSSTTPGLATIDLFKMQLDKPWPNCSLPVMLLSNCRITWQQSTQ